MKCIYCILLVSLGAVFHSHGQDLAVEFKNMYSKLEKLHTFRFVVDYACNDTTDFSEKGKVSVLVTPKGYFYQTDFCEILINEKNTILINEEERTIIYSNNHQLSKKEEKFDFSQMLKGIDSLVTKADSVYFSFDGFERVYYLRFENQYFNLMELRFAGDMLKRIDYYYNEKLVEKPGIKATNDITLIEDPTYDVGIFETTYYFKKQNETMVPTELFSAYGIIYNESTEELLK